MFEGLWIDGVEMGGSRRSIGQSAEGRVPTAISPLLCAIDSHRPFNFPGWG